MSCVFKEFNLKVELVDSQAKIPTRACGSDAGLDLYTPDDIEIAPGKDKLIPLGIRVEFPAGYAMIVKEKSGVATKKKLDVGACVIDAGYRGICHVHLFNNGDEYVFFKSGEKVAQAIIVPVWDGQPIQVEKVNENTERGAGGFGSTGA
jgi:dUTP pyrophosphatase